MVRIVQETENYLLVDKPHNMKTAPLSKNDRNTLLSEVIDYCPQCEAVKLPGRKECEHGLIHRLDTPPQGLVLIAKTVPYFEYLLAEQAAGRIIKTYTAKVAPENPDFIREGYPVCTVQLIDGAVFQSRFRSYGRGRALVRPVTNQSGRAAAKQAGNTIYETAIQTVSTDTNGVRFVTCSIVRGFRHQIRSHLSWAGMPIIGDKDYGGQIHSVMELHAVSIAFRDDPSLPKMTSITL